MILNVCSFEGELVNRTRDKLAERVSTLEAELQTKASTLHSYEVLITSMQNELVLASLQKEKALMKITGSPLTPRSMEKALEPEEPVTLKTGSDSPMKDEAYLKLLNDRDAIRNALVSYTQICSVCYFSLIMPLVAYCCWLLLVHYHERTCY